MKTTYSRCGLSGRKSLFKAFPLSPLLLPCFYFFSLLFTSHHSPLSERLEQATKNEWNARNTTWSRTFWPSITRNRIKIRRVLTICQVNLTQSIAIEYQNICGTKFSRYLFSARSEFGIFIVFFNEVFSSYVIRVNCVSYISCCQSVCSSFGSATPHATTLFFYFYVMDFIFMFFCMCSPFFSAGILVIWVPRAWSLRILRRVALDAID